MWGGAASHGGFPAHLRCSGRPRWGHPEAEASACPAAHAAQQHGHCRASVRVTHTRNTQNALRLRHATGSERGVRPPPATSSTHRCSCLRSPLPPGTRPGPGTRLARSSRRASHHGSLGRGPSPGSGQPWFLPRSKKDGGLPAPGQTPRTHRVADAPSGAAACPETQLTSNRPSADHLGLGRRREPCP